MRILAIFILISIIAYSLFAITSPTEFFTNVLGFMQSIGNKFESLKEKLPDWVKLPYDNIVKPKPIGGNLMS